MEHFVNVEPHEENRKLQMRESETEGRKVLPSVSRGLDLQIQKNSSFVADSENEVQRAGLRPRLSGQGEDSASAVLVRSEGGNASCGLQQTAGSNLALPETSLANS